MNLKEIIKGLIEYDSATAQNALMTMDEYDKEQIDYSSPDLKSYYLGSKPVVGIAVTCKVTPLYEPKKKIDWDYYYNEIESSELPVIGVIVDIEKNKAEGQLWETVWL